MSYRIVTVLCILCALSCAHKVETIPQRPCPSWDALDARSKGSFTLASCSTLDPETWDSGAMHLSQECTVGSFRITGKREPDDVYDSYAEISNLSDATKEVITLRPEPRISQKLSRATPDLPLGCSEDPPRIYVGHRILGYVVAYQLDGKELWRVKLPEFEPVSLTNTDTTGYQVFKLIESQGGVVGGSVPMGSFLAVPYRVKGRWYEAIIHRSGVLTALLGPWDGVLEKATGDGWTFAAGGQAAHGGWRLPTERLTLRLTAQGVDPLVEHFLAWLLPEPTDTTWTWRACLGHERFVRLNLGARYHENVDEIAQQIHDGLGSAWAATLFEHQAMIEASQRGELTLAEWKAKVKAALLEAGADVDAMRYAREHGLLPTTLN